MAYTQSKVRAEITVGPHKLGLADKFEGGDGDVEIGEWYTAAGQLKLPGNRTREDATATFLVTEEFWRKWLDMDRKRGAQMPCRVVLVPIGDDDTPFAAGAVTLTGYLKTVPVPPVDYSSSEGSGCGLVLSLHADAA